MTTMVIPDKAWRRGAMPRISNREGPRVSALFSRDELQALRNAAHVYGETVSETLRRGLYTAFWTLSAQDTLPGEAPWRFDYGKRRGGRVVGVALSQEEYALFLSLVERFGLSASEVLRLAAYYATSQRGGTML